MRRLLGLVVMLVVVLAGCSSSSSDDVIRVGMECDYAPHNWTTTAENASEYAVQIEGSDAYCDGYDVMIASRIAESMGKELEIYKIAWDGLIPALQSNQIDMIIAGMSPTEERKEVISFSDSYYTDDTNQWIVVNSDSQYADATSLQDFEGAKISAQMGTLQEDYMTQIPGVVETESMDSYTTLMQATESGAIDGYIVEETVALEQVASSDQLTAIELVNGDTGFTVSEDEISTAIGMRQEDTELIEEVNAALAEISDEERQSMMDEASQLAGE